MPVHVYRVWVELNHSYIVTKRQQEALFCIFKQLSSALHNIEIANNVVTIE